MKEKETYAKGAFCATFGAVLWAVSGACGQILFEAKHFDAQWLTVVRLLCAGTFMLILCCIRMKGDVLRVWKTRRDAAEIVIYGIIGLLGIQYTYFLAIQYSNAATATVIQYLSPAMIMLYMILRTRTLPTGIEVLSMILAISGIFLLVTHGNPGTLTLSATALFWSIMSAVTMAIASIQPRRLLGKFGTPLSNGWGMLIGGICLGIFRKPWEYKEGVWDWQAVLVLLGVVVLGTILSFFFYQEGVRMIGSTKASLYATMEPLAATLIGIFFLNVAFGWIDWAGSIMIVSTVFLISLPKTSEKTKKETSD